jgi:N utilization substance protein B
MRIVVFTGKCGIIIPVDETVNIDPPQCGGSFSSNYKITGEIMKRREAREQAFALVFARSINHEQIRDIVTAANETGEVPIDDFAEAVATGVEANETVLDEKIESFTRGWAMNRLSKVSLSILRLAVYEILFEKEIPTGVSINEAVELAKKYGAAEDAPFVNGVLGSLVRKQEDQNA